MWSSASTTSDRKNSVSLKYRLLVKASSIISAMAYRSDGTVNRFLLNLVDFQTSPSDTPVNGVTTYDHTIDKSRGFWFRLFVPVHSSSSQLPVIIYFHGGGFVRFSASSTPFDTLCRRIAGDNHCVVISVNYRLAPEHKFPAQIDDGFDVVRFVDEEIRERVKEFPVCADLQQCFLAGDSSGGNIAHHVLVACDRHYLKEVRFRGLVIIQPFFGGEIRTDSETRLGNEGDLITLWQTDFFWKAFLPSGSDRDHPAVNVFPSSEDKISDIYYPNTLVIIGMKDMLQDGQKRYVDGLKRSGKEVEVVEYLGAGHGFYATPEFIEFEMLIAKVGEFVRKHTK